MEKENTTIGSTELTLSPNMEDYMETIGLLSKKSKVVRVKDIAKSLNIKMPSVTAALNKLKEKKLINYEKYGFIELTVEGLKISEKICQRHSCISDFLNQVLKINKNEAELEACQVEHYLSSETCQKIEKFMLFFDKARDKNSPWIEDLNNSLK